MPQDLWPEDIAVVGDFKPPIVILREQASLLSQKTKNLVEGIVTTNQLVRPVKGDLFNHQFLVNSPSLNYTYVLFSVTHPAEGYPVKIIDDSNDVIREAKNNDEFIEELKEVFSSSKTKKIITALIAQAQSPVAA